MSVDVYYFIECKEPSSKQWKCIFNHNRIASLALRDAIRGYTPGEIQSQDFTIDNNPGLSPVVLQAMCRAQNERNQFYSSKEERHPVIWSWADIGDIFNYLEKKIDDWFEKLDERTVNSQNRDIIKRLDTIEKLLRNSNTEKPKRGSKSVDDEYYKGIANNPEALDEFWDILWLFSEYQFIKSVAEEATNMTTFEGLEIRIVYYIG